MRLINLRTTKATDDAASAGPKWVPPALKRGAVFVQPDHWHKQRDQSILDGRTPAKRGRKPKTQNPLDKRVAELERENQRLLNKLRQAQIITEAQRQISEILGIEQNPGNSDESK